MSLVRSACSRSVSVYNMECSRRFRSWPSSASSWSEGLATGEAGDIRDMVAVVIWVSPDVSLEMWRNVTVESSSGVK